MNLLLELFHWVLHVDQHLDQLIQQFGVWFYALMFLVIFCETGLVITPFLPGDSLLFALGAFAARGSLQLPYVLCLIPLAAILGDLVNYHLGKWLGPKIFSGQMIPFLNPGHLEKTKAFYAKHGSKTVIMARFVPIVRTFAPFVAGMGRMPFPKFFGFSVIAGLLWTGLFVPAGYYFAKNEFVQKRFPLVILVIILISLLPILIEWLRNRKKSS